MISLKNIHPLSEFLRNAKSFVARLKKSGEPVVLTVNGEAEIVILSTTAYEDLIERMETYKTLNVAHQSALESLRSGEISPDALIRELREDKSAKAIPVEQAFAEIEKRIQQRRKRKAS